MQSLQCNHQVTKERDIQQSVVHAFNFSCPEFLQMLTAVQVLHSKDSWRFGSCYGHFITSVCKEISFAPLFRTRLNDKHKLLFISWKCCVKYPEFLNYRKRNVPTFRLQVNCLYKSSRKFICCVFGAESRGIYFSLDKILLVRFKCAGSEEKERKMQAINMVAAKYWS